jgi:Tfp pilus assembly protein PilN
MAVALDLTPAAWKQQAASAVTQRRFLFGLGAAVAVWVISAAVLWGGPVVLEKLVKWREQQIQKIASDYKQVANAMERVKLIRNYMDRSNSVLESMRTVVISQPEGVDLTSLTYRRGESIKVSGEALDPSNVYAFKDGIENNPPFGICTLGAVSYDGVRRKHRFELEARFGKAGGEQ